MLLAIVRVDSSAAEPTGVFTRKIAISRLAAVGMTFLESNA